MSLCLQFWTIIVPALFILRGFRPRRPRTTRTAKDPDSGAVTTVGLAKSEIYSLANSSYYDKWRSLYAGYGAWKTLLGARLHGFSGMPRDIGELRTRMQALKNKGAVSGKGTTAVEPFVETIMASLNEFRIAIELPFGESSRDTRCATTTLDIDDIQAVEPDATHSAAPTSTHTVTSTTTPTATTSTIAQWATDREKVFLAQIGLRDERAEMRHRDLMEKMSELVRGLQSMADATRSRAEDPVALLRMTCELEGEDVARARLAQLWADRFEKRPTTPARGSRRTPVRRQTPTRISDGLTPQRLQLAAEESPPSRTPARASMSDEDEDVAERATSPSRSTARRARRVDYTQLAGVQTGKRAVAANGERTSKREKTDMSTSNVKATRRRGKKSPSTNARR